ncbi:MAG TPA: sodium/proline symporter PutP [Gammaproteobacteria bacterium]|nr:sodium/proline symporter PutP [Gammaproteobacteria bacterium]
MDRVSNIILYTFAVYMIAVLSISFVAWFRNKSLKDYILAGRGLGSFVTALSAQASDMSGWLLLALPGAAYAFGMGYIWMVIGLAVGTYLNWLVVARRLREQTQHYDDALTLPDYFSSRFGDKTRLLRGISALMILVFFAIYVSSSFVAGAELFESLFHVSYFWALVFGALTVISYTFIGGFLAVAWNDVLQGSLMFFALLVVGLLGLAFVGGFNGLEHTLNAVNNGLLHPFFNVGTNASYTWIGIASLLAWGLGYPGQPHILARFMAIKNPKGIAAARRIAMFWVLVALFAAMLVGLTGLGVVNHPLNGNDRERVFIYMALKLLPPIAAGICLSGILAAIMSTASAQLLVAAGAFAEDLYRGFFRHNAGRRELLWVGRLALLAVAIIAFFVGINPNSLVLGLVAYAWAGFGAAFGPAIILALYWNRMNWQGALAGMIVGGVTVLVWHTWLLPMGGFFGLYEIVPGFVFSAVAIVFVSMITPAPKGKPSHHAIHARG